jgi:hypothetical protein
MEPEYHTCEGFQYPLECAERNQDSFGFAVIANDDGTLSLGGPAYEVREGLPRFSRRDTLGLSRQDGKNLVQPLGLAVSLATLRVKYNPIMCTCCNCPSNCRCRVGDKPVRAGRRQGSTAGLYKHLYIFVLHSHIIVQGMRWRKRWLSRSGACQSQPRPLVAEESLPTDQPLYETLGALLPILFDAFLVPAPRQRSKQKSAALQVKSAAVR